MEDNDNLDSFFSNSMQESSDVSANNVETSQVIQKPKLRKIKRAKIRPSAPLSPAPEKIMPNPIETVSDVQTESITKEEAVLSQTTSVNKFSSEANPTVNEDTLTFEETAQPNIGTDLVTASDAQEMTTEPLQDSYVLEGLPPELDYEADENYEPVYEGDSGYIKKSIFYTISCVSLLFGLFVGKAIFSSQVIENHGLEGVVTNPDVPQGRPRCGLTDKSQACIFYMMNWYKQELNGRDFYKLAAQLTGREEYMIETDNLRYATVKIRPGHFAQLNIPALKE